MAIITVDTKIRKGKTVVDFLAGMVFNMNRPTEVETFERNGRSLGFDKIRSLFVFCDTDLVAEFVGAEIEFDMMSFNKALRGFELETIVFDIDDDAVPDEHRLIIIASDDPKFDYSIASARPHLYYSNEVEAVEPAYVTLFERHTILDKVKVNVFNNLPDAKDIEVTIEHRELPPDDASDQWMPYEGYDDPLNPVVVPAGGVHVFGDDANLDTKHHFHRVRVKTVNPAETSDVGGSLYGV